MNKRKTNILNDEVVISLDNIEGLSKILAIISLRDFETGEILGQPNKDKSLIDKLP